MLEAVLESNTFARADQLRRFLRYICEKEIAHQAQEISEYSIATEALGRSSQYLPGGDSSVRSRAHALRQKLQEYYEAENKIALIRIELRKGSYVPLFVDWSETLRRAEATQIHEAGAPVSVPAQPAARPSRQLIAGAFLAGVLLTALVTWTWFSLQTWTPTLPAILREAWGPALDRHAEVLVCIASPPALLLKSFRGGKLPDTPRLIPTPKEISDWYAGLHEMDGGGDLYMQTTMNTMLSGDALAAARAVRFLSGFGVSAQVLPEWGMRPLVLRGRNVLLIGSPNYSPYAGRILRSTPFTVRYDPASREEVISDRASSSPAVYRPKRDDFGELTQVYGLLTVLPSQSPGERREQTVIFSGITSAGPQAAMEFFSSPVSLQDLKQRLAREGYSRLPAAYQVVLRCGVDRALALTWNYETHRVIAQPPRFE